MRNALAVVALLAAASLLLPVAFGLRGFAITGGSMGDALPEGSLAFDRGVAAEELQRGDVVTFVPAGRDGAVTHRVVGRDDRGVITRGDANSATDPWRLTGDVQRVVFHVPFAGRAVAAAREVLLGGALLVVAGLLLGAAARPRGQEATA